MRDVTQPGKWHRTKGTTVEETPPAFWVGDGVEIHEVVRKAVDSVLPPPSFTEV